MPMKGPQFILKLQVQGSNVRIERCIVEKSAIILGLKN